jgi:excisionase family DNA binding protein
VETFTFWRERETRFLELTKIDGSADFHAIPVEIDMPSQLEQSSTATLDAIADPSAPLEAIYERAKWAARAGRILLAGEQLDRWNVSGGPNDRLARETLESLFRAEALMAAVGAGEADDAMTDQAALEAWLDLMVREKSPHWRTMGVLEHLAHASAEMSRQLASRAYRDVHAPAPQVAIAPTKNHSDLPPDAITKPLTRQETARHLRLSEDTIDRMIRDGKLKSQKVGRRRLIPASEVIRLKTP